MEYVFLCRNMEEAESKLQFIESGEDVSQQYFMELERSMEFLKHQIAAESASHSNQPDCNLFQLSGRFDILQSAINSVKSNLFPDLPFDQDESCCLHPQREFDKDEDEEPQDEEDEDKDGDESCCLHGDEVEEAATPFTVYSNPIAEYDQDDVPCDHHDAAADDEELSRKEEGDKERAEKGRLNWPPMLLGVLLGGLTVAVAVTSVVVRYDVRCHFSSHGITGFPPPT